MYFHNRDGQLDSRHRPRSYGDESKMALSAIDCVLSGAKGIYVSTQLTTGQRLYRLMREAGVRDAD